MSNRDLVSSEGVDEASAASTAEGAQSTAAPAASPGPRSAGTPERPTTVEGGGDDLLGEPPHGAPDDDEQEAGPADMESEESRAVRAEQGPGQQYQVGEG